MTLFPEFYANVLANIVALYQNIGLIMLLRQSLCLWPILSKQSSNKGSFVVLCSS
jgi:hypothetical protein